MKDESLGDPLFMEAAILTRHTDPSVCVEA